jgi:hypothetical protein
VIEHRLHILKDATAEETAAIAAALAAYVEAIREASAPPASRWARAGRLEAMGLAGGASFGDFPRALHHV